MSAESLGVSPIDLSRFRRTRSHPTKPTAKKLQAKASAPRRSEPPRGRAVTSNATPRRATIRRRIVVRDSGWEYLVSESNMYFGYHVMGRVIRFSKRATRADRRKTIARMWAAKGAPGQIWSPKSSKSVEDVDAVTVRLLYTTDNSALY